MDRRQFLRTSLYATGAAVTTTVVRPGIWARPAWADDRPVRVYLVVIDGLRPDELAFMPNVSSLARSGTFYPQARAEMIAETTPNHIAMLTGVRADRHGIPGNSAPGRAGYNPRLGDNPRYLRSDSLFTIASRQAPDLVTASITSKQYLVNASMHDRDGDGEPDATYVYEPRLYIPVSDHETDYLVMEEVLRVSRELDPHFCFVNLGDVDRVGHADATGGVTSGQAPVWRTQTLTATDTLVGALVRQLENDGKWDSTVLMVTADHNMDWSFPDRIVNLYPEFQDDDLLHDEVLVGVNGGAAMYALRYPLEPRAPERLRRMREIAVASDGVRDALYTAPNPVDGGEEHWVGRVYPQWRLTGDLTGDLVLTVEEGWRVSETGRTSNPIPGNHGHPTTIPIPMIIAGGWEGVRQQRIAAPADLMETDVHPAQGRNIDLGPTTAWLLGLGPPRGGFDGRVLEEAFTHRPPAAVPVRDVVGGAHVGTVGDQDPVATAVAVSAMAFPDGAPAVVIAGVGGESHALSAVPLAVALAGPLLVSRPGALSTQTAEEVRRLGADRAVLLGDGSVLSDQVAADLREAGVSDVQRIAGDDEFATAGLVAERIGAANGEAVLVSTGDPGGLAAALAAGAMAAPAGRPVLLTTRAQLPDATRRAIEEAGVTRLTIVGDAAAISTTVEEGLRSSGLLVERLRGDAHGSAERLTERGVREGALTDVLWLVRSDDILGGLAAGAASAAGTLAAEDDGENPFWFMNSGDADLAPSSVLVASPGLQDAARAFLERRQHEFVHVHLVGRARTLDAQVRRVLGQPAGRSAAPGRDEAGPTAPVRGGTGPQLPATGGGQLATAAALMGAALGLRARGDGSGSDSVDPC